MTNDSEVIELLRDIKSLLEVLAEPKLQEREKSARDILRRIAGRSEPKRAALLLMNGQLTRQEIIKSTQIDPAEMTRLTKAVLAEGLLTEKAGKPAVLVRSLNSLFVDGKEQ
jgi:phosphoenolpyruvate-protein kinase (PTS system EI component)